MTAGVRSLAALLDTPLKVSRKFDFFQDHALNSGVDSLQGIFSIEDYSLRSIRLALSSGFAVKGVGLVRQFQDFLGSAPRSGTPEYPRKRPNGADRAVSKTSFQNLGARGG